VLARTLAGGRREGWSRHWNICGRTVSCDGGGAGDFGDIGASAEAFHTVKYAGAAYLVWFGDSNDPFAK